jgi:hypothetical protein
MREILCRNECVIEMQIFMKRNFNCNCQQYHQYQQIKQLLDWYTFDVTVLTRYVSEAKVCKWRCVINDIHICIFISLVGYFIFQASFCKYEDISRKKVHRKFSFKSISRIKIFQNTKFLAFSLTSVNTLFVIIFQTVFVILKFFYTRKWGKSCVVMSVLLKCKYLWKEILTVTVNNTTNINKLNKLLPRTTEYKIYHDIWCCILWAKITHVKKRLWNS